MCEVNNVKFYLWVLNPFPPEILLEAWEKDYKKM